MYINNQNTMQANTGRKKAVILGNGPSLKGFDFQNKLQEYSSFGMNVAYRYWDKINWYPDYYSCLDIVVGLSHLNEIKRLIEKSDEYGIKNFLLRKNLIDELGEISNRDKVLDFDEIRKNSEMLSYVRVTTGSHTAAWAAEMGFKDIFLLGIDSNYTEFIPEAQLNESEELVIVSNPKENPNYFFDDYQQVGDKYNIPNRDTAPEKMVHRESWKVLSQLFVKNDILVINANTESQLECFYKVPFDKAESVCNQIRSQKSVLSLNELNENENFSEDKIIMNYFEGFQGTVIEVGAHFGSDTLRYLQLGWQVHAFEPDTNNMEKCLSKTSAYRESFCLSSMAVSDKSGEILSFYTSKESSGISSLHPFHYTHELSHTVETITLHDYIAEKKIEYVDLLRIDTEGFDLKVLRGFPFEKMKPKVILCEFEDNKTLSLGYSTADMIEFLQNYGYSVYISEWCPIVKYGVRHTWKHLLKVPDRVFSPNSWGNLLAFQSDPGEEEIKKLALKIS